jgi:hypothetical protein
MGSTRKGTIAGTTAGGGTGGGAPCGIALACGEELGSALELVAFASTEVEIRLDAAGLASALVAFAVSFAVFASLFPAMTGTAMTAITSRLNKHIFSFNIDDVSSFRSAQTFGAEHGVEIYVVSTGESVTPVT